MIMKFKLHYCKFLMHFVSAKVEECSTTTRVVKLLDSLRWTAPAWNQVTSTVIRKCFRKGGILNKSFKVVHREATEDDPF